MIRARKLFSKVDMRFPMARNMSNQSADMYCMDLVKKHDYDSYIAGLLIPKASREAYFAIKSFNVEISMIKDNTHGNLMAGRIRCQWWRDLFHELYNGLEPGKASMISTSPIAQELAVNIDQHDLSQRWFERSLDARQRDLGNEQPESLDMLEDYAEQGHSSIQYLILESLGVREEISEYATSHIGVCSGLTTILRAFPYHQAQKQIYLPREMMASKGLEERTILQGAQTETELKALRDCIFEVASQAHGHLEEAQKLQYASPTVYALMPGIRSQLYLEALRLADFDPTHPDLMQVHQSHLQYQLKILYASISKKL